MGGLTKGEELWNLYKAHKADWPAIVDLQSAENRPMHQDSRVSEYFVAKVDHELVGCVAGRCKGEIGYLYGLVVRKEWRRQGIGHALTGQCLAHLQTRSAGQVFALAMFWNVRFFKGHRFIVVKRSTFPGLIGLHGDFCEAWGRRSALLCVKF
jgi:N-acetylglutamate synthase-like GNAT family acetyltransferase